MISQQRLKEILDYDPKTGVFIYKIARANKKPGDVAGNVGIGGYRTIMIDYKAYYAHHLAVLFMTGSLPPLKSHTDHRNRKKDQNWWGNIKVTTPSGNGHNRDGLNKNNTSGATGIRKRKSGRFAACICVNYMPVTIGTFNTMEAAVDARDSYRAVHALG